LYKYAHITNPAIALARLKQFLVHNEANTLGILLQNVVNLDFDNMDEYHKFVEMGLIEPYTSAVTRVNKTPKGVHYLFQVPPGWYEEVQ